MKVTLKQAFNILDGRLSTEIDDVYKMLNFIFDANLMTHQLPDAMRKLEEINPVWFSDGVSFLGSIKKEYNTDNFQQLMNIIENKYKSVEIEINKVYDGN